MPVINEFITKEDYLLLIITRLDGQKIETKISLEDYEIISKYKWSFKLDNTGNYRIRTTSNELNGIDLST